ncbi:MAG: hypothetical protein RLN85_03750, partial [Pseudomonadales bacterium]
PCPAATNSSSTRSTRVGHSPGHFRASSGLRGVRRLVERVLAVLPVSGYPVWAIFPENREINRETFKPQSHFLALE